MPPVTSNRLATTRTRFIFALALWVFTLTTSPTQADDAAENGSAWPYSAPVAVPPPSVDHLDRVRNPIDTFILRRLEEKELTLAPDAAPHILVRRLYLALIGLPPTPREVANYVNDHAPDAYPRLVDRLLSDPRYGRALGTPLARPGSVCRHRRVRGRSRSATRVAISRLRDRFT